MSNTSLDGISIPVPIIQGKPFLSALPRSLGRLRAKEFYLPMKREWSMIACSYDPDKRKLFNI